MKNDPTSEPRIKVSKLDAARRQLRTAIRLWFEDGDPVAIHTLIAAAYDILHTLSRRKGARDLIFDSRLIKDEYRRKWIKLNKSEAAFFKHADYDPEGEIDFVLFTNEFFMLFSMSALHKMNELLGLEENAFLKWFSINRSEFLKEGSKYEIPLDLLQYMRTLTRKEFFDALSVIWAKDPRALNMNLITG
ncbi:MAG: hypothetical protein ACRDRL_29725 [Sciscionella sp.]